MFVNILEKLGLNPPMLRQGDSILYLGLDTPMIGQGGSSTETEAIPPLEPAGFLGVQAKRRPRED